MSGEQESGVRSQESGLKSLSITFSAVAAVVVTSWLIGRILSDRFGWTQWLLWIPTPAALLAVALGGLGAALSSTRRRRQLLIWAAGGGLILLYFGVIEHHFFRAGPRPGGLRLVHWNGTAAPGRDLEAYVQRIFELDGDVAILNSPPRRQKLERMLGAQLDAGTETVAVWPFVLVARVPVLEARPLVARDGILVALFRLDTSAALARPITIYAIDLPSRPSQPRLAVARRTRRLLDAAGAPPPDIVVGDLNMTRGSASLRALFPELEHAYDQAGRGYAASFPRAFPLYHLDHTLLADTLQATGYTLVDPKVGRHRSQVVNLEARADSH